MKLIIAKILISSMFLSIQVFSREVQVPNCKSATKLYNTELPNSNLVHCIKRSSQYAVNEYKCIKSIGILTPTILHTNLKLNKSESNSQSICWNVDFYVTNYLSAEEALEARKFNEYEIELIKNYRSEW